MTALRDALQPALPEDADQAVLTGRVWRPDLGGPSLVAALRAADGSVRTMRCCDHAGSWA